VRAWKHSRVSSKAPRRELACLFVSLVILTLASCHGSSPTPFEPGAVDLTQPKIINLYPVAMTTGNPARLFIFVKGVGSHGYNLPLAFDTGSAGITLNAAQIFPEGTVTSTGFAVPLPYTFDGITVTSQRGTRTYGNFTSGRTEHGNLGYAAVTFGDADGTVTTSEMPMFLYYDVTFNDATPNPDGSIPSAPAQVQQGWFGVNTDPDFIPIKGSDAQPSSGGNPACSKDSEGSCYVDSVLKHVTYTGIDAGFALFKTGLATCDITNPGNCPQAPVLTVGLTPAVTEGFSFMGLSCPPARYDGAPYSGPSMIGQYPVCVSSISTFTISSGGLSFPATVLFDSGTPYVAVNVPQTATFTGPAIGATLDVTARVGFLYSLVAGTGVDAVAVTQDSGAESIVGLPFFTTNDFFIDFANNTEGWK
jgi:hypothetical protein